VRAPTRSRRPSSTRRAGSPLGRVQHRLDRGQQALAAELGEQRLEPALGEVATEVAAVPHIGGEQPQDVVALHALVAKAADADSFLPDLGRARV
jgi:hypothetical protein